MYGTVCKNVELYQVKIKSDAVDEFEIDVQVINAEKPVFTHLPNPQIADQKSKNSRIRRLAFSEEITTQDRLPVHVILGAADVQRIKTTEPAVLGPNPDTDPGAEFTMLGWVLAGKTLLHNLETKKEFFACSSRDEFNQMCSQEVLGLTDSDDNQEPFHENFQAKLHRLKDGTYSTRLP